MSAPRHLSRVILQILAIVDPIAEATEDVIEPIIEERDALRRTEEQLRHRPPELIGTSHWQLSLSPILEIVGFLEEPHKGKVQAIWTGASVDHGPAGLTWKILPINPGDRIAKCYASWQGDDLLIRFEVEDGPAGTNIRDECNRIIGSLPASALAETEEELTDLVADYLPPGSHLRKFAGPMYRELRYLKEVGPEEWANGGGTVMSLADEVGYFRGGRYETPEDDPTLTEAETEAALRFMIGSGPEEFLLGVPIRKETHWWGPQADGSVSTVGLLPGVCRALVRAGYRNLGDVAAIEGDPGSHLARTELGIGKVSGRRINEILSWVAR